MRSWMVGVALLLVLPGDRVSGAEGSKPNAPSSAAARFAAAADSMEDAEMPRYGPGLLPGNVELPELFFTRPDCYLPLRGAGADSVVIVNALVGTDGRIKEVRVLKSIPELDSAAIACVRGAFIRPLLMDRGAVEAWMAIPVRFASKDGPGTRRLPPMSFGAHDVSRNVAIVRDPDGFVRLTCLGQWEGVGFDDSHGYVGALRFVDTRRLWGVASFRAEREADGRFAVRGSSAGDRTRAFDEMWTVQEAAPLERGR